MSLRQRDRHESRADHRPFQVIAAKRLLQCRTQNEPMAGANALHRFDERQSSAAHQLHNTRIMLLAETLDHIDSIGLLERHIENPIDYLETPEVEPAT